MNSSLNHVYRIVWNATLGLWQVASEATRGRGKTGSSQQARKARRALVAASALALVSPAAWAILPTGGVVVAGQASIQQAGNALNIVQGTDKAAIDWQSFSIGQGNTVNFQQLSNSSVALNRVLGNDVSVIQGAINANGQVFLVNQNGVLFTPTAQVNVGGIVASTQNISTDDFMAGRYKFSGNSTATVENQGSIKAADGGVVALIAAKIINTGNIEALKGTVGLAAGNTVLLDLGGPMKIQVTEGALNAAIEQSGGIRADGGTVYLTAKAAGNLAASVINHTGVTKALSMASLTGEAGEVAQATGSISLSADIVSQGGTLDASGLAAGTHGGQVNIQAALLIDSGTTLADGQTDGGRVTQRAHEIQQSQSAKVSAIGVTGIGGFIEYLGGGQSGGNVYLSGRTLATGRRQGGRIDATANNLTLAGATFDTSATDVAGKAGMQRIGGGWQGKEADLTNAVRTLVTETSTLNNLGQDGMVVVWSDDQTIYAAALNAAGSAVEVSGKENLSINTAGIKAKSLLLDPKNIEIKRASTSSLSVTTLVNPNNTVDDNFGSRFIRLSTGNIVIAAGDSDLVLETGTVSNVGRIYLYSASGALISTLSGSSAGDSLGSFGISALSNGNFLVRSSSWDASTTATDAGAVTFVNGVTGVSGVVSASNSLVGSSANDSVGLTAITILNNGNYVVRTQGWDASPTAINAGAVTFGNGTSGVSGVVSASNSLVGKDKNDSVGSVDITILSNGNYVVGSPLFTAGSNATEVGAATFGNGTTGVSGVVSASNSLVGSSAGDRVGGTIVVLSNGNYLVSSSSWDASATATNVGAVTFGNGTTGVSGVVSASNSLVGSSTGDMVGSTGINILTNGNYVVSSQNWDASAALTNVGAVTFGNGSTGVSGVVSSINSLVGSSVGDNVGSAGVSVLTNGNYVVRSQSWDASATVANVGAVTWGSGISGVSGEISASNSLIGSSNDDQVGLSGITTLSNGNYVVRSSNWDASPTATNAGAVTFGNGSTGVSGVVSASNSLVGSSNLDQVGNNGVTALSNGNYVVRSANWDASATVTDVGAVTFGNGVTGISGEISAANSLVGSTRNDLVGDGGTTGLVVLSNGNYLVRSANWDASPTATNAGAVTWGSGASGVSGVVSANNSLVGSSAGDNVGGTGITILSNGNYLVRSSSWDASPTVTNAGAVTFGDGSTGVSGVISATNSLIGSRANDSVGSTGITLLTNGNYVVRSQLWDASATVTNAGAVTWGSGTTGVSGVVSASNSLVGSSANDSVGSAVAILTNGNYVVQSISWNASATATTAGAATWGNGTTGVSGVVSASNSLVGSSAADEVGFSVIPLSNGNYVVNNRLWDASATLTNVGAVTFGNGSTGVSGLVSASNSLVGSSAEDRVGNSGVFALNNGNYVVATQSFDASTALINVGAVTMGSGITGVSGVVSTSNSLIGSRSELQLGSNGSFTSLQDSRVAVFDTKDGAGGSVYLLAPNTVTPETSGTVESPVDLSTFTFANNPGANNTISPDALKALLDQGTAVTLQANNDITLTEALTVNNANGSGGALTLEAGRNININNALTTDDANFTAIAGSANAIAEHRDAGDPTITIGSSGSINAGTGTINLITVGSQGKFVNNAGATPFTAAKTFIYLPTFNTGNTTVTTLGGLTAGKRYNTTFNATTGAPTSTTARLDNLTGVNLLYAAAPVISVTPSNNYAVVYGDKIELENSALSGFVDGDISSTAGAVLGTEVIDIVGAEPVNGLRNAGKYNLVYKSGYTSDLGYTFADAAQVDELTITPRNLTIVTNDFVSSATANAVIDSTNGLVTGQSVSAVNLAGKNLSVAFGENTLGSNYNTTLIVPATFGTDLSVNRDLTFDGINLTLVSSKDINIRSVLDGSTGAGGKLTLEYGQGAVAAGNTANFNFGLTGDGFAGSAKLKDGQNFSTKLGLDVPAIDYTVITQLGHEGSTSGTDLQGMNGNLTGNFALGADINAGDGNASTANWNSGAGFEGIGSFDSSPFTGRFTGLGHSISGLTINRPTTNSVGLFDFAQDATIRDVQVLDANVVGNDIVGALAGLAVRTQFFQVASSGEVSASGSRLGGLIGSLQDGGITQAFSAATVKGVGAAKPSNVGGLVGNAEFSVDANLSQLFATGAVSGRSNVGGLFGNLSVHSGKTTLTDAYARGDVTGTSSVGGLIGSASLTGGSLDISRVYAVGKVTGTGKLGGLVGAVQLEPQDSSSTPKVDLINSFWDTETTTQTKAIGFKFGNTITDTTAVGKTTADLKLLKTFTDAGWNITGTGGAYPVLTFGRLATVWLTGQPGKPVFIRLVCGLMCGNTYGDTFAPLVFDDFAAANGTEVLTDAMFSGTATYNVLLNGQVVNGLQLTNLTDAGTYSIVYTGGLTADGFIAQAGDAITWTVAPRAVTVSGITVADRDYNGNTLANVTNAGMVTTGVGSQTLVVNTVGNFANRNVGTNLNVDLTSTLANGAGENAGKASNYTLSNPTSKATASITRLDSVMWIGGNTGDWFDANNWAGGAIPDLSNVANVVLPKGVTVTFNGKNQQAVSLDGLGEFGALAVTDGTLNLGAKGATLGGFNQTGGTVKSDGSFTVSQVVGSTQVGNLTVGGNLSLSNSADGGQITQLADTAVSVTGTTLLKAPGNVNFGNANNTLTGVVTAQGNDVTLTNKAALTAAVTAAGNAALTSGSALTLGATNVGGTLSLTSKGNVTQTAGATVKGATSIDATGFDVSLLNSGNNFTTVNATADDISLLDTNGGVVLGNITATGNTQISSSAGDITQTQDSAINAKGTTQLVALGSNVSLTGANNSFGGLVTAVGNTASLNSKGALSASVNVQEATLSAAGNLAVSGKTTKGLTTTTTGENSTTTFGNTSVGTDLTVTSTGNVAQQQNTALTVGGKTSINAAGKDVTLSNATNNFKTVDVKAKDLSIADGKDGVLLGSINATGNATVTSTGGSIAQDEGSTLSLGGTTSLTAINNGNPADITLTEKANTLTGAVTVAGQNVQLTAVNSLTVSGSATNNLTTTTTGDRSATTFGTTSVGGALNVTSTGLVEQTTGSTLEVKGKATVEAKGRNVTLANAGNDFGSIGVTGNSVSITDKNAVALDAINASSLTVKAGGDVTQNAAASVASRTTIDAAGFNVSLNNAANDFAVVDAKAKDLVITDAMNGVILRNITATGNASVTSTGGDISQGDEAGTLALSGTTNLTATNGDAAAAVTLSGGNNTLGGLVTASGSAVTLKAKDALSTALTATEATLTAGGNLAVSGKITKGLTTTTTGENSTTTFGSTDVGADLTVTSTGKVAQVENTTLTVGGKTSINAGAQDVALGNAGNAFNSVQASGGAVSIADKDGIVLDAIKATSLNVKAGGAVTQVADKALEVTGATTLDAGANDVTLANANNDFGSIGVTAKAASIVDKNAVALDNIKAESLNVKAVGAVTQVAEKALEVTGATSVDAGANAVTLGNAGNDFNTVVITAGAASITDKNAVALDNIKATSLTVKAGGDVSQVADKALDVTGATSVDAGVNTVTLANANNDFGSIGVIAGAASITDKDEVALDAVKATSLTLKAGGSVTQNAAATVTGATSVDAGTNAVTLTQAGNDFGSVALTAGAASITDTNAVALDAIKANSLTVKAGGAVTQNAAALVTGATSVDAGTNAVTLTQAGNDFGSVALTAGAASITDKDAVALDAISATSLTVKAGSAVTQNAAALVTGATTVDAGTNAVTLTQAGNDFGSVALTAGAASITDKNAVALDAITATSLTVKAGGAVTQNAAASVTGTTSIDAGTNAVMLTQAGNAFNSVGVTGGAVSITDKDAVALDAITAASLTVKAGGAVTQNAAASVTGATSVDAGANAVTLANAGNNFGSVGVTGGAVSITDTNAAALDAIKATSLTVKAGGAVTQVADKALAVTGATSVDAGTNAVTLANTGNDFANVAVTGGAVSLTDTNAIALDAIKATSLMVKAGGAVTQVADKTLTVTGATSVDAAANAVTLANSGNNFGSVGVTGGAVSLTDTNAVALDAIKAASLTVKAGGAVTQNAAATVSGATSVDAKGFDVSLNNADNDFGSVGVTAGAVSITDKNAVALNAINATSLSLKTAGVVTQNAAATVTGATSVDAKGFDVSLDAKGNDLNTVSANANSLSIADGKGGVVLDQITATGNTSVSSLGGAITQTEAGVISASNGTTTLSASVEGIAANVTLANAGNDFKSVGVTGNAVSLTDKTGVALDAITANSLKLQAGGDVTQNAAATVKGVTSVDAGTNAVALTQAGNDFGNLGVTGGSVSITDTNAVALDAVKANSLTVKAGGDVSQVADKALDVTGATSVDAGANTVTLANANNDFGSASVTANDVSLFDSAGGVVLGAVVATGNFNLSNTNGAITQTPESVLQIEGDIGLSSTGDIELANLGNRFDGDFRLKGQDVTLGSDSLIRIVERDVRSLTLLGAPNANMTEREAAIASAQALEPKLDLPSEREAMEERSGDVAPFFIAANQPRANGPAQLVVVNGGIRLPNMTDEEQQ